MIIQKKFTSGVIKSIIICHSLSEEAKRKVFARDPVFGGSCVPKPLPLMVSNITGMPQASRNIKRAKVGVNKEARGIKTAEIGIHST